MTLDEARADERRRALGQHDTASNYVPPKFPDLPLPTHKERAHGYRHAVRHALPELRAVVEGLASGVMVESVASERVAAVVDDLALTLEHFE